MTNATHRIGLVGTGYWGKNLLRKFTGLNFLTGFFGALIKLMPQSNPRCDKPC